MTDAERRLAELLHRATPEPPRALSATRIMDRELEVRTVLRPRRRVWPSLLAAAAVITVIVAVVLAVTTTGDDRHPRPAVSPTRPAPTHPTTTPTTTTPEMNGPPPDFAATRLLGTTGQYSWKLTSVLRVTADGGAHWTRVPLPDGLKPSAIDSIQVGADGAIFVADAHRSQTVDLYRRPVGASTWSMTTLTTPPPGTGYQAAYIGPIRSDGNLVTVVTGWGTSYAKSVDDVWISTDGGVNFARRRTGVDSGVKDVLFLDAHTGILVSNLNSTVYRTTDGGRHWVVALAGHPGTRHDVEYGSLLRDGGAVLVPRITGNANTADVALYRSTDDGATFHPQGTRLRLPNADLPDDPFVGIAGPAVWVTGGGSIVHRSDDGGRTWSTALPDVRVARAVPTGPTTAIGFGSSNCSSDTNGCWQTDYLMATTDGGRTWHSL